MLRSKVERDNVLRLLGNKLIDGYVEETVEYKVLMQNYVRKETKEKELDKFITIMFLGNTDQESFGDLLVEYRRVLANNENKYPATMVIMMDAMRQ